MIRGPVVNMYWKEDWKRYIRVHAAKEYLYYRQNQKQPIDWWGYHWSVYRAKNPNFEIPWGIIRVRAGIAARRLNARPTIIYHGHGVAPFSGPNI